MASPKRRRRATRRACAGTERAAVTEARIRARSSSGVCYSSISGSIRRPWPQIGDLATDHAVHSARGGGDFFYHGERTERADGSLRRRFEREGQEWRRRLESR